MHERQKTERGWRTRDTEDNDERLRRREDQGTRARAGMESGLGFKVWGLGKDRDGQTEREIPYRGYQGHGGCVLARERGE
jgi:hypothetical protein